MKRNFKIGDVVIFGLLYGYDRENNKVTLAGTIVDVFRDFSASIFKRYRVEYCDIDGQTKLQDFSGKHITHISNRFK